MFRFLTIMKMFRFKGQGRFMTMMNIRWKITEMVNLFRWHIRFTGPSIIQRLNNELFTGLNTVILIPKLIIETSL